MPKVTVMMPAYNAEKYIRDSLRSVLRQDCEDMEVIVVDDCSTDNTYKIASEFKKDRRVRLFRNRRRLGIARTRNRIMRLARGKYIAPHDADDIMLRGRLRRHVAFLEKKPDFGVVFGSFLEADEKLKKLADAMRVDHCSRSGAVAHPPRFFHHCAATISKKHIIRAGGYDPALQITEDSRLILRLFKLTKVFFLNRPCFIYRIHSKSMTQKTLLKGAGRFNRIFSGRQKNREGEKFSVIVGGRKLEIDKVTPKALSAFGWRLTYYKKCKMRNGANNRFNQKAKWDLSRDAALANSDEEMFQRGFLEPFSAAINRHNQTLVRAALVSCEGKGVLLFASDTAALKQAALLLILHYRYRYHSIEAPILFLKNEVAYGESLIVPIVLTRGCEWVRKGYERRIFWNPRIEKSFFDVALSSPHLLGKQCGIATIVRIVTDRKLKRTSVKPMKFSERYTLLSADSYGKQYLQYNWRQNVLQKLAQQTSGFLVKTPPGGVEALPDKLIKRIL